MKKSSVICAVIFSAIYVFLVAAKEMTITTGIINTGLWICICIGFNWAKRIKIILDVIITAVYIAAGFQIITSGSLPELSFISVLYTVLAVSVPVAEILILYKPEKNKLKK